MVGVFPVPLLEQPESYGIVAISVPKLQPDGVDLGAALTARRAAHTCGRVPGALPA